jgi:hypothetical protein
MKIGAQMTLVACIIFAVVSFGVAIKAFTSIGDAMDAKQAADAYGFAWFWTFLGAVGAVFGAISWWMIRTHKEDA